MSRLFLGPKQQSVKYLNHCKGLLPFFLCLFMLIRHCYDIFLYEIQLQLNDKRVISSAYKFITTRKQWTIDDILLWWRKGGIMFVG